MKSLSTLQLIIITIVLCTIVACSKDDSDDEVSNYISGTDITLQLKDDFKAGIDVILPKGHFYTSESIIVEDYSGMVSGAGKDLTIIEAAQGFQPLPDPFLAVSDSGVAQMFAIYTSGDITFQDMTFLVTGDAPAKSHNNPFHGLKTTIDNIIVVVGGINSSMTVTYKNLVLKGEVSEDPGSKNGRNIIYPLIATGWQQNNTVNLILENCEIENAGQVAIEYFSANGGLGEINGNLVSNSYEGVWLGWEMAGSEVNMKDNNFVDISNKVLSNDHGCSCCFMNNTLDGVSMADHCPQ